MTSGNAFSSFPGHTPALAPSAGDVSRFTGTVGAATPSAVDFATRIKDNAMNRGVPGSTPQAFTDALPGILAQNTHTMDAGMSRLAQRGDQPKHWAILGKPHREGPSWDDGGYEENVTIWNATRDDPKTTRTGNTLGNICALNYYGELGQVIARSESVIARDRLSFLRKQYALDAQYVPTSARDFFAKWKPIGPISRPPEGTFNGQATWGESQGERLVPYVYDGTAETNQLFGTNVRRGDQLWWSYTQIANPYNAFYLPNGRVSTARSGTAGESILQVRGFSSSELPYVPRDSSRGDGSGPRDDDLNYVDVRAFAATTTLRYDWDDDNDTFTIRNVAREEGVQEAVEYMSTVVWEAYRGGYAYPVGIAIDTNNGPPPSQAMLDAAHRSPDALARLQTVRYLVARKTK